jgi:lipoprotein-anchoring transpeptidase ErfK/SrfK
MREARALGSPASAETSSPNTQSSGNPLSTDPEPSPKPAQTKIDVPDAEVGTKEASAQAGSQILINIDKSRQQMTVLVNGMEKYSWQVSTGKYGYSTPSGTFTPTSMNEVWYSKQWDNSPMPHSIFFLKDGHAIHGSHQVKTLGKPVSHGCVRISPQNAAILYDLVKTNGMENTKVVLVGITPGDESNVPEDQPYYPRQGEPDGGPWFGPGSGYDPSPPSRGLFGGWGPYSGAQGRPKRGYYRD